MTKSTDHAPDTSANGAEGSDTTTDWGIFGRPLFLDEQARALSRVGVIDIGSNSVRLVVFDGAARSPAYFYNEKILCGLGAGLRETGRLNPEGKVRAMSALRRFSRLAEGMGIAPLTNVATAAMRDAEDGAEFSAEIEAETGMAINVIDGEEEARLSAQGVLLGWPEADGLVCDIGGSSMELAEVSNGKIGKRLTSPLGALALDGIKGGRKGLRAISSRSWIACVRKWARITSGYTLSAARGGPSPALTCIAAITRFTFCMSTGCTHVQ